MSLTITVIIENCRECIHHDLQSRCLGESQWICFHDDNKRDWKESKVDVNNKIPNWCPLKHGSSY